MRSGAVGQRLQFNGPNVSDENQSDLMFLKEKTAKKLSSQIQTPKFVGAAQNNQLN